jgi:hypothetical protein
MGYITFTYGKDKKGEIEVANYGSSLEPWHLQWGGTTKHLNDSQAGQYGRGLKTAIVTFRRSQFNHNFRIVSSEFNWSFGWDRYGMLNLNLRRIETGKLVEERVKAYKKPRDTHFRPFEQGVSIIVGQKHQIFSRTGEKAYTGEPIKLEDFEYMLSVSPTIVERPECMATPLGSIITDPSYRNKIYKQGLLVSRNAFAIPGFYYGYDLREAAVAADRDAFVCPVKMVCGLKCIWAIACQKDRRAATIYVNLLLDHMNRFWEVHYQCPYSDSLAGIEEPIWSELLSRKPDENGPAPFYYVEGALEV